MLFLGVAIPKPWVKCIGSLHHQRVKHSSSMIVKRWSFLEHNPFGYVETLWFSTPCFFFYHNNLFVGHVEHHNSLMVNLCQITHFLLATSPETWWPRAAQFAPRDERPRRESRARADVPCRSSRNRPGAIGRWSPWEKQGGHPATPRLRVCPGPTDTHQHIYKWS